MRRRGYAGTLRVSERTILERLPQQYAGLHRTAVERLARLPMKPEAAAIVEAMAAGERRASPRTPRPLLPQRTFALAGRVGTSHGIVCTHQRRAVVAAAAAPGTPAEKPAGSRGRVALRRGGGISAERRAGRRDVHRLAGGIGLGLGIRRDERLATAAFGMLLWNPNRLGDISFQPRSSPWRASSLGRAALPPLPDPVERAERRDRRLPDRSRRDPRHGAACLPHLRRRAAG